MDNINMMLRNGRIEKIERMYVDALITAENHTQDYACKNRLSRIKRVFIVYYLSINVVKILKKVQRIDWKHLKCDLIDKCNEAHFTFVANSIRMFRS